MTTITKRFSAHGATCTVSVELPAPLFGVLMPSITWEPRPPSGLSQRAAVDLELMLHRACARIIDEALEQARGTKVTRQQREPVNTLELGAFPMQSARP